MENWALIAKYISSEANDHEKKQVELWLAENPDRAKLMATLQKIVRPDFSYPDFKINQEIDWQKLQNQIEATGKRKTVTLLFTPWRIAASILFIALLSSAIWYAINRYDSYGKELQAGSAIQSSILPDGTKIWLNKKSRLQISDRFGEEQRSVILEGEAYFEVVGDATKPFIVVSNNLVTKVRGTAFNIKGSTNKSVIVTVSEGKVMVYEKGKEGGAEILVKDQMAHYDGPSRRLDKTGNTDLNYLTWKTRIIRFQAEPLSEVCRFLSAFYNQKIYLKDSSLKDLTITTTLDNTDIHRSLTIISSTLNLDIEKTGDTFYLVPQK
jgi:transmembrane sensor